MRRFLRKGSGLILVLVPFLVVLILPALDLGYPKGGDGNLSNANDAFRHYHCLSFTGVGHDNRDQYSGLVAGQIKSNSWIKV